MRSTHLSKQRRRQTFAMKPSQLGSSPPLYGGERKRGHAAVSGSAYHAAFFTPILIFPHQEVRIAPCQKKILAMLIESPFHRFRCSRTSLTNFRIGSWSIHSGRSTKG